MTDLKRFLRDSSRRASELPSRVVDAAGGDGWISATRSSTRCYPTAASCTASSGRDATMFGGQLLLVLLLTRYPVWHCGATSRAVGNYPLTVEVIR